MSVNPKHKLLSTEKDADYTKSVVDYYIQQANLISGDKSKLQILYEAAEGILDDESYRYVLNPYNTENDQLKRFPSKLRNYDIISPVLKLFLGENSKKPKYGTVVAVNSDAPNKKKAAKLEIIKAIMAQDFINNLNEIGLETGVPSKEVPNYEQASNDFENNYDDLRARVGQEALDYLIYNLDIDDKIQRLFYDWLVVGRIFTYKDIYLDDVEYEVCDPRDIYVVGWGKTPYVEDADAVIYVRRLTANSILDDFQDLINEHTESEKIVEYLDSVATGNAHITQTIDVHSDIINNSNVTEENFYNDAFIRIYQVSWKTFKKVGVLTYIDEFGIESEMPVDDTYKLDKKNGDISIDWIWINEVRNAYQIEDKWVLDGEPIPVQRNQINNPSVCKLPFNGTILGYRNSQVYSVVQQGLNYQVLYNIFHYRWELLLAKNKDKILAFPKGLIPNGGGWDEDKFFYWMAADGIALYDEAAPKAQQAINGIKAIDLSMGSYMANMWEFMLQVKNEWWELIGMNRQRYGDSYASDGKANTEQAILRSSVITSDMYRQFDKFMEKEYNGLLDLSKIAWIDGKKGMYINSDSRKAWLDLESQEDVLSHMETEYGVFVKNTSEEMDNLQQAKNLLQTMGQNGLDASMMLEILDSRTIGRVKELARKGVEIERKFREEQQQQQLQSAERIAEMQNQLKQAEMQNEQQIAQLKSGTDIEVALIQADASLFDVLNNTAEMEDTAILDEANNAADRMQERRESRENLKQANDMQLKREQMNLKREDMANKLAVAKENKNRFDSK